MKSWLKFLKRAMHKQWQERLYHMKKLLREYDMNTTLLTSLRDYLFSTLTPSNLIWLGTQLTDYGNKKKEKPFTGEKMKVGIIGCGWIAGSHVVEYKKMNDVTSWSIKK